MALWHFTSAYTVAGGPKGENALMTYARKKWMYQLILEEEFDDVIEDIEVEQARVLKENPRLRRTEIKFGKRFPGHLLVLHIGRQSLSLIEALPMVKKNKFPKEQ